MGQASASKIRRRVREREGVARFIAETQRRSSDVKLATQALLGLVNARANGIDLTVFDVHAAREAAEALVRLDAEQGIFEDWCRALGLGPENREPGAFGLECPACEGSGEEEHLSIAAGYLVNCHTCTPRGTERPGVPGPGVVAGGWPGKLAREWQGRDPRAPMGRSLARLGRRVLAAIEGQPSECGHWTANDGQTMRTVIVDQVPTVVPCGCHGTGHNLRGSLPAVELSPAVRRALADSVGAVESVVDDYENLAPWQRPIVEALDMWRGETEGAWAIFLLQREDPATGSRLCVETRVVPRGEHRIGPARGKDDPPWTLDQRINGRGYAPESKREAAEDMRPIFACSPAWRRGETRAQETRFRRAWEAVGEEYEGQWWMPRPDPLEAAIDAVVDLAIAREAAE